MLIETVATSILKKGAGTLVKSFGTKVIERWSTHRAKAFVESFVTAVREGKQDEEVAPLLEEILESERNSEILFEAYRSVSLSKSRDIGPRASGLLTAQIISENRVAAGVEERWFQTFESLSDMDLIATEDFFTASFAKLKAGDKDYAAKGTDLQIKWSDDLGSDKAAIDISPIDLFTCLGPWAGKLSNLGLMRTRLSDHIVNYSHQTWGASLDGALNLRRKVTYWIDLNTYDEEFSRIIAKAHRMVPQGALMKHAERDP